MQSPVKTIPFYPLPHYKSLRPQEKQNKQYWNKIAIIFLEKKYNTDTTRKGLPMKMYIGGPPHKLYFIALMLQGQIIIGPSEL